LIAELRLARSFLGGDVNFERLGVEVLGAVSRGHHTLLVGGLFGSGLGGELPIAGEFRLGGLFRLSGAEPGSVRGSYAGLVRLAYYLRPGAPARQTGGAPLRFGAALEAGQAWDATADIDLGSLIYSVSVFTGLDTLLGPVSVGWSWMTDRSPGWFLQLGPAL
jgi:NTE family protein